MTAIRIGRPGFVINPEDGGRTSVFLLTSIVQPDSSSRTVRLLHVTAPVDARARPLRRARRRMMGVWSTDAVRGGGMISGA